jgi:hypothetical protein
MVVLSGSTFSVSVALLFSHWASSRHAVATDTDAEVEADDFADAGAVGEALPHAASAPDMARTPKPAASRAGPGCTRRPIMIAAPGGTIAALKWEEAAPQGFPNSGCSGGPARMPTPSPPWTGPHPPEPHSGVGLDVLHDDDDPPVGTFRDRVPDGQTVRRKMKTVGAWQRI